MRRTSVKYGYLRVASQITARGKVDSVPCCFLTPLSDASHRCCMRSVIIFPRLLPLEFHRDNTALLHRMWETFRGRCPILFELRSSLDGDRSLSKHNIFPLSTRWNVIRAKSSSFWSRRHHCRRNCFIQLSEQGVSRFRAKHACPAPPPLLSE